MSIGSSRFKTGVQVADSIQLPNAQNPVPSMNIYGHVPSIFMPPYNMFNQEQVPVQPVNMMAPTGVTQVSLPVPLQPQTQMTLSPQVNNQQSQVNNQQNQVPSQVNNLQGQINQMPVQGGIRGTAQIGAPWPEPVPSGQQAPGFFQKNQDLIASALGQFAAGVGAPGSWQAVSGQLTSDFIRNKLYAELSENQNKTPQPVSNVRGNQGVTPVPFLTGR